MNTLKSLPIAVIGAGPVGLAAAAHLMERGERPLVFEAGASAGTAIRNWAHVRLFSPWRYLIDPAARRLLERQNRTMPDLAATPTGGELVSEYLEALAAVLGSCIRFRSRVVAVSRSNLDKVRTARRADTAFVLRVVDGAGNVEHVEAKAVIDASGTWFSPNPMGASGLLALGEAEATEWIDYGIPDVTGKRRQDFLGLTTLVVGSGHSAFNAVLDLVKLKQKAPRTRILWAMRKQPRDDEFGAGSADALPERGALGERVRAAIRQGDVSLIAPFSIDRVDTSGGRLRVSGLKRDTPHAETVDRIIVATGFRPELGMLRELRLELDPTLESSRALGPLIDPNEHSCGTVRPHGARDLAHPEPNFYIVGMKSYGRAPTFLLAIGYEQVRSVVAALVGDNEGAARVELELPETGGCGLGSAAEAQCCSRSDQDSSHRGISKAPELLQPAAETCCGGAPKSDAGACCALDEAKKAAGESGCGCGQKTSMSSQTPETSRCCG
jgi:thioredoxin reductase